MLSWSNWWFCCESPFKISQRDYCLRLSIYWVWWAEYYAAVVQCFSGLKSCWQKLTQLKLSIYQWKLTQGWRRLTLSQPLSQHSDSLRFTHIQFEISFSSPESVPSAALHVQSGHFSLGSGKILSRGVPWDIELCVTGCRDIGLCVPGALDIGFCVTGVLDIGFCA